MGLRIVPSFMTSCAHDAFALHTSTRPGKVAQLPTPTSALLSFDALHGVQPEHTYVFESQVSLVIVSS